MARDCFWREWGQREAVVVGVDERLIKTAGVLITGHRVLKFSPWMTHILASRPIHPFSVGDCVSR